MVLRRTAMGRLTAAFLAALAIPAQGQAGMNCELSDLDEYEFVHSPGHGLLIYWTRPTTEVSFLVEAESEQWTSVGFSSDGSMVGSDAVIYLPGSGEVSEHILESQSETSIFSVPGDEDELTGIEFSQSGGDTIFSFTRYTTPVDPGKMTIPDAPGSPIYIIWAEGMDNDFGYHGQANRGAFLVDLFCGTDVSIDIDASAAPGTPVPSATGVVEGTPAPSPTGTVDGTPAPSAAGTVESTVEGTMGSTPAATATSSAVPLSPAPTTAPTAAAPATLAPAPATATATPAPLVSPAPVVSASVMPVAASVAPATPSITMPPGGFVEAGPVASSASPVAAGPTTAPIPSSLGVVFGSAAPAAPTVSTAPVASGPTIPFPPGETPAPSSAAGARAIGDDGVTPPPSSNSTGFVGGAARVGGGVTGAAVASAVAAVCLGIVWTANF